MGLNFTENVKEVNDNAKKYVDSSIEYYKLDLFKKVMRAITILAFSALLGAIAFMAILIITFAVARDLGRWVGEIITGYYIMGGIYIVLLVLVYVFLKKPIEKVLIRKFSDIFFTED